MKAFGSGMSPRFSGPLLAFPGGAVIWRKDLCQTGFDKSPGKSFVGSRL
jgi:hypothetical protein